MNVIEQFLDNNCDTETTRVNYSSGLKHFFKTIGVSDPDKYFKSKRDFDEDIMNYWRKIQDYAPMTRRARISIVNMFLEEYDIILSKKTKKKLKQKLKGSRPVTLDVIPTNQELKQILSHGEAKAKAMGLLASSSGLRLDEILGLEPDDIDFNHDPVKIDVRAEIAKLGIPRITFCSNEAAEAIKEWLKERNDYLATAVARCAALTGKSLDDNTIFCFNESNANKIWRRLLRKSGFDKRDKSTKLKYHKMHFHTLRKYFETRMSLAKVPEPIIQTLQGHTGYLNGAYKRYTEQDLAESYKNGVKALLVFESQPDLTGIQQQMDKKDEIITEMQKRIDSLENKYGDLLHELVVKKEKNKD